jgi:hypothetical protein
MKKDYCLFNGLSGRADIHAPFANRNLLENISGTDDAVEMKNHIYTLFYLFNPRLSLSHNSTLNSRLEPVS